MDIKKFCGTFIAAALIFSTMPAQAYDRGDFQIWNTYAEDIRVYKGVKFVMGQEYRYGAIATELYYQHYDWGAVFCFNKMFDLGFFYRQVFQRYRKKWRVEDVPNVNATIKFDMWKFRFEDRNRLEYKHYRYKNSFMRYRNKLCLKLPLELKRLKVTPYLADEVFVASNGTGYNENRFYAGTEFELTKNAKVDLYYLLKENRINDDKWTFINTLGIKAKISF